MNERLDAAMRRWTAETSELGPPPEVEQAVLAEFDRSMRARRRVNWFATAVAAAAALTVVIWLGEQGPVEAGIDPDAFVALPYVIQPAKFERTEVVRMTVPVAELISAGLPLQADPNGNVEADVLFGQDRRARAVRLVSE